MTAATIVCVRAEATGSVEPIFVEETVEINSLLESTELTEPA